MCEIHQSPCECLFQRTQLILLGARPSPEIFMLTSMSLMALRHHMTCLVNDVCHAGPCHGGLRLSSEPHQPHQARAPRLRLGHSRRRFAPVACGGGCVPVPNRTFIGRHYCQCHWQCQWADSDVRREGRRRELWGGKRTVNGVTAVHNRRTYFEYQISRLASMPRHKLKFFRVQRSLFSLVRATLWPPS